MEQKFREVLVLAPSKVTHLNTFSQVKAVRLITEGTVEEKILALQEKQSNRLNYLEPYKPS